MDVRRDLANNVADALLVRRVGEREQQADGHRVDIGLGDGLSRTSDAVLVELDLHAVRPDALGHRETQFARHEGAGRTLGEVVERGSVLPADLDHVAESLGRHERRACAPPLEERVGRHRRAMGDRRDRLALELGYRRSQPLRRPTRRPAATQPSP